MKNDSERIKRYFGSRYSKKDYQFIKNEFEKRDNPSFFSTLQEHWMEYKETEVSEVNMEPLLNRVHHRIFMEGQAQKKQASLFQKLQRVAAILFIPLLISFLGYMYFSNKSDGAWAEIQCPIGVRTQFHLPDGTTGYLNSGSNLKYPVQFANNRSVKLTGEALFDVVHNSKEPFHVITSNLDIKVMGTRFNVAAFNDEGYEEVTLQEGHIEISNNNKISLASLKPNQQFSYDCKSQKHNLKKVDSFQYLSWTEGKLCFRDENFIQVSKRLSRWYKVDIEVGDTRIGNYIYHATFENEQLEDVLRLIELTAPITCQITEREKKPDGSFSPKKIVMTYNEKKQKQFK